MQFAPALYGFRSAEIVVAGADDAAWIAILSPVVVDVLYKAASGGITSAHHLGWRPT